MRFLRSLLSSFPLSLLSYWSWICCDLSVHSIESAVKQNKTPLYHALRAHPELNNIFLPQKIQFLTANGPRAQEQSLRWDEFDGTEICRYVDIRYVGTSSPCRWNRRNDGLALGLCRYVLVSKSKVKLVNKHVLSINLERAISLMELPYD